MRACVRACVRVREWARACEARRGTDDVALVESVRDAHVETLRESSHWLRAPTCVRVCARGGSERAGMCATE